MGVSMIDQTISHFRIIEKLGSGGMGVVYKAIDTRLDRPVALKFLPDNMADDSQALERFRREAHAASALNHPGICTIYDIGEQEKRPFIAMEFIDGETLRQHIHGQPLPLEELLDLGIQIADALDVAHSGGIVHRDIKPSNVFVTKRGQAKVLDFGLAKLVARDVLGLDDTDSSAKGRQDSLSIVGVISGTPAYMSPEQVRGDELDQRTDIFAFGLLLYEMATGRQAFGGRTGGAIIEAILTRAPAPVRTVNPQVPEQLEEIIGKCLQKDRNLRYPSAAVVRADLQQLKRVSESGSMRAPAPVEVSAPSAPVTTVHGEIFSWRALITGGAVLVVVVLVGGWFYNGRRAAALTQTDTVVLSDFINKTGDPIFEDTLRQGLAAQLQQSPFLSLVSEQRIQQTLRLMGLPADGKVSPTIAGDLCQRVGSKAYLSGTISSIGNQYVIGVSAVNCRSGDSLAEEQVTADGKEHVLKALGEAATRLRGKLGESLKTVQKLDTPIEQATTPSLEALQAYSLGRKTMQGQADFTAAVPLFERAIELDPKFAMAHAMLGTTYHNLGEKILASNNTEQAYQLRAHVSEWEKFYIESHYHDFVTGDLEKARQAYELWEQIYPRELVTPTNLGVIYQTIGQFDKSLAEYREGLRISPADSINFGNLTLALVHLNRRDEARAAGNEALSKNLDSADLRAAMYQAAFLGKDLPGMAEQVAWSAGKPGKENLMLYLEAGTAAYAGKLKSARELADQSAASAARAGENEMAAGSESAAALWEALYGNAVEARRRVNGTLAQSNGRDAQYAAALALALIRDSEGAQVLADDLQKRFSEDTIVRFNYLPTLQAQIALVAPNGGVKAAGVLATALPYELGVPGGSTFWNNLYPVYVRGEAFLDARQGLQAAAEFQKVVDWGGVVVNEPIAPLAVLGLGRAYALAGDTAKAKARYEEFFTLWKDADSDIPVLVAAKAEYAKLK
jgi:tetratricopeptide (TPR) repeat protein/predicted Ser/Thr protein kinase